MTSVSLPPDAGPVHAEALIDLYCDVIRLAVHDARRGSGRQLKTQHRYATAVLFLERLGVLDRVVEKYGIDVQAPYQHSLLEG